MNQQRHVSVIGLGYVGLPVAVEFACKLPTIGYDISATRISELKNGFDRTGEVSAEALVASGLVLTDDLEALREANFHIVAVPTPIDSAKRPNLTPLLSAARCVGSVLSEGDIVVFESTVYPGVTEDECVPALEAGSNLVCGRDFTVGYSPERINPGDATRRFREIVKVVSGQDEKTLEEIARVYSTVVTAGVHRSPSIKVAEAAKVIENTQRDLNIALVNELSLIFARLGIDTLDVLEAAGTKWNFLPFRPGLVGGHCIGVDPYYLTHRAAMTGYNPQVILAGRRINDGMGKVIVDNVVQSLIRLNYRVGQCVVTVLGLSFKENVPDIRNTLIIDVVKGLSELGVTVQVHDPVVDAMDACEEYSIQLHSRDALAKAQCVVLAVAHDDFTQRGWSGITELLDSGDTVVADIKGVLPVKDTPSNVSLWRL